MKTVERRNKITLWDRPIKLQVWDLKKSRLAYRNKFAIIIIFYSAIETSFWKPDLSATVRNILNQT